MGAFSQLDDAVSAFAKVGKKIDPAAIKMLKNNDQLATKFLKSINKFDSIKNIDVSKINKIAKSANPVDALKQLDNIGAVKNIDNVAKVSKNIDNVSAVKNADSVAAIKSLEDANPFFKNLPKKGALGRTVDSFSSTWKNLPPGIQKSFYVGGLYVLAVTGVLQTIMGAFVETAAETAKTAIGAATEVVKEVVPTIADATSDIGDSIADSLGLGGFFDFLGWFAYIPLVIIGAFGMYYTYVFFRYLTGSTQTSQNTQRYY